MHRSTTRDDDLYGTVDVVEDAGFVVAAFITLVGTVVCVIATLTTTVLVAAGALVPEAPIVAALGLLTAVFFGAMAVAWAEASGIALPGLAALDELPVPETTTGPLRAMR